METTTTTFRDLGVSEEILRALEKKGLDCPTKVQLEAIGPLLQWRDVIAKAPTGTGKTFAFGIPIIEHIDAAAEDLQALILAPTRELAIQIGDELQQRQTFSLRNLVPMKSQFSGLFSLSSVTHFRQ